MIATGAENPSDVAIYRLPEFQPVTVGEGAHKDWVFALQWLDDEFLLSGSRDSSVALWRFRENPADEVGCSHVAWAKTGDHMPYPITGPVLIKKVQRFDKVRALSYNYRHRIATSVSLNSYMHILDIETFAQVQLKRLGSQFTECVCVSNSPDENILAVGCRAYLAFFDARGLEQIKIVALPNATTVESQLNSSTLRHMMPYGVRSLSWRGPLITLGTGGAEVLFYDVRNDKFLSCNCGKSEVLSIGSGYAVPYELYNEIFQNVHVPNAVYTHCYDPSGTRLFTAGGPIAASVWGNFATLWV